MRLIGHRRTLKFKETRTLVAEVLNFPRYQLCGWLPSDERFSLFLRSPNWFRLTSGQGRILRFLLSSSSGRFQVARVTANLIEFRFASKTRIDGTLVENCDNFGILFRTCWQGMTIIGISGTNYSDTLMLMFTWRVHSLLHIRNYHCTFSRTLNRPLNHATSEHAKCSGCDSWK